MKAIAKETKRYIVFTFNKAIYKKHKVTKTIIEDSSEDFNYCIPVKFEQLETIEETADQAMLLCRNAQREFTTKRNTEYAALNAEENKQWEILKNMDVIPATFDNIKIVIKELNKQNWGGWILPQLSISYTANQHDIDGLQVTTMAFDQAVETRNSEKSKKFKTGSRFGLPAYTNI